MCRCLGFLHDLVHEGVPIVPVYVFRDWQHRPIQNGMFERWVNNSHVCVSRVFASRLQKVRRGKGHASCHARFGACARAMQVSERFGMYLLACIPVVEPCKES